MNRLTFQAIFPEKLTFDGLRVRTARVNEAVQFIYLINSKLQAKKRRTNDEKFHLSAKEPPAGIEPATY
jgi:site-specific DNA recombinase